MSCYFIVSVYEDEGRKENYAEYIKLVKPIVEKYEGEYLVRTDDVFTLSDSWKPDRLIVIRFPDRKALDQCFSSKEYIDIMHKRETDVDSRAIIVGGLDED